MQNKGALDREIKGEEKWYNAENEKEKYLTEPVNQAQKQKG